MILKESVYKPIIKTINGKDYTVVKRESALTKPENFEATKVIINEIEIPKSNDDFNTFIYNDTGASFLSKITIDEFNAMVPFEFNAKCVEKLGNRLFAANVEELTWDIDDEYDTRAYRSNGSR